MYTTRIRRLVAAAVGLALAAGLATGCGSSSSEHRAADVAKSADAVEERARDALAMDHALAQRLIGENEKRLADIRARDALAMDSALAQRLIHENRERLAEVRPGCR